jgi:ribosome biogenesis GTPase / thiamine phosphate phosphatase
MTSHRALPDPAVPDRALPDPALPDPALAPYGPGIDPDGTDGTSARPTSAHSVVADSGGQLDRLGLDADWRRAFEAARAVRIPDLPAVPARVTRTDRGACDLLAASGPVRATWGADVLAAVAHDPLAVPSTGDWVRAQPWPDGRVTVEAVLPRRTAVVRAQASGTSSGQVLAANVDVVAVVEGLYPDPDLGRLERFLALAWESGAQPRVVLTKSDLESDGEGLAADVAAQVAAGCPVDVPVAHLGTGLDGLRGVLADGATVALVGASGVGKSTLLNALLGREVMATRTLGAVHKGRHTTVTRELHLAPGGGSVVDTPGLRSVGLQGGEGLADVFTDVEDLAADCRFADCSHRQEPGCAVLAAVEAGDLPERRLESWRKLQREAAWQARRVDDRLARQEQQIWRARARALSRAQRQRPPRP